MSENVTPLAKLVVNTARTVVADPLQVCVHAARRCVKTETTNRMNECQRQGAGGRISVTPATISMIDTVLRRFGPSPRRPLFFPL